MATKYTRDSYRVSTADVVQQMEERESETEHSQGAYGGLFVFLRLGLIALVGITVLYYGRHVRFEGEPELSGPARVVSKYVANEGTRREVSAFVLEVTLEDGSKVSNRVRVDSASWQQTREGQTLYVTYYLDPKTGIPQFTALRNGPE